VNISTSATAPTSTGVKPTARNLLEPRQRLGHGRLVRMLQLLPASHPSRARFPAIVPGNGGGDSEGPATGWALAFELARPGQLSAQGNERLWFYAYALLGA